MKIFVTGGAGFIGSHIVDRMLGEGHRVTVLDNFSSGKRQWLACHDGNPAFRLVHADLLDREIVQEAVRGHDLVWHLAGNIDIPSGIEKTDLDLTRSVVGTWNVLEAMRVHGVRDMLFASSAAVYGEVSEGPFAESDGPLLPVSHYGAGKVGCEAFISSFSYLHGLRAWIFRFANVVGSRMQRGVIHDFIDKLRRNPRELEVLGDGAQTKPYFLVEECIGAMLHAYRNVPMTAEKPCDVFNLGPAAQTGVNALARIVIEEMGLTNVRLRHTGGKRGWPGDQPRVFLNVDKMRNLGWEMKHSSDEAVRIAVRRLLDETAAQPAPLEVA